MLILGHFIITNDHWYFSITSFFIQCTPSTKILLSSVVSMEISNDNGIFVGDKDGTLVGAGISGDGFAVGICVGIFNGDKDGSFVGDIDGEAVGEVVGDGVSSRLLHRISP